MIHGESSRWGYAKRILAAVGMSVLVVVLVVIFGPRRNPDGEWFQRTGVAGPMVIVDNIEVVPDAPIDELSQEEQKQLAATTQGVQPVLTDRVLAENPNPLPLEQETGRFDPNDTSVDRDGSSNSRRDDPASRVRRSRSVQQSMQFVLLESVNPKYPTEAGPRLRQREVVVMVAMYVDESGHVRDAYVQKNNGGSLFAESVLTAVRKWVYKPLVINGEPSDFWDQIRFIFTTPASPAQGTKSLDATGRP
jgi:TonB family protein